MLSEYNKIFYTGLSLMKDEENIYLCKWRAYCAVVFAVGTFLLKYSAYL